MSGKKIRSLVNKDIAGAVGTLGGGTIFISRSTDIHEIFKFLYSNLGLVDNVLLAASNISTDAVVVIGSALMSFLASKLVQIPNDNINNNIKVD